MYLGDICACLAIVPHLRKLIALAILIAGLLITGVSILLYILLGSSVALFIGQIVLLTVTLCLIPTFVHQFKIFSGRVVRIAVESILYFIVFLCFGLWLFGLSAFGNWIAYALVLLFLLEVGSNILEWQKDTTLKRLSSNIPLKPHAEEIEKLSRSEVVLYLSVPLGLLAGMIVGLVRHQPSSAIILFCFQLVLLLASFVLSYFLIYGFKRMCDPMFQTGQVSSPQIVLKKNKGFLAKMLEVIVPPTKPEEVDQQKEDLDLACDLSDLRKVYKYDSLHNVVLLVAFAATLVQLWGELIDLKWVIISLLIMTFVLSELPYAIGQNALRLKVLERYTGVKHAELAKKLKENAPVFPPLNFIVALMTTGTAGGFLYTFLNQFVQDALKNTLK